MIDSIGLSRLCKLALLVTCSALVQHAAAEQGADQASLAMQVQAALNHLGEQYPKNAIDSVAKADRALSEAASARALIQAQYAAGQRSCASKFFANACIDRAKEQQRSGFALIRPIELEASAFKRRDRVDKRDQALQDKQAKAASDTAFDSTVQDKDKSTEQAMAQRAGQTQKKHVRQASLQSAADDRVKRHQEKLQRLEQEDARQESQRASNVDRYQEKVRTAAEHQKKLAEKRKRKALEKANKEATATP
jgi:colicin import membrane protein